MNINPMTVGFVLIEITSVDIAVLVKEATMSLSHTVSPVAVILSTICPILLSLAVFDPGAILLLFHLSGVDLTVA